MIRMFKTLIGILLIPFAVGVARAFYSEISGLDGFVNSFAVIERGILVYLLFHVFVIRPVYLYVLGHELIHVLATWLCGGRIDSFRVTPSGGSVTTSKTNMFIELSPYFVPIYTLLLGPIFMFLRVSSFGFANLNSTFLFFLGITLAFHFVMTAEVLKMQQSDIAKSGVILSLVFIFVGNLVITMAVFCPFFGGISFLGFIKSGVSNSITLYTVIFNRIMELFQPIG